MNLKTAKDLERLDRLENREAVRDQNFWVDLKTVRNSENCKNWMNLRKVRTFEKRRTG